jgi:hypothetical protein
MKQTANKAYGLHKLVILWKKKGHGKPACQFILALSEGQGRPIGDRRGVTRFVPEKGRFSRWEHEGE